MTPINPVVVRVPSGRVGCLVARHGLQGCIEFGDSRFLHTFPLVELDFLLPYPAGKR